MCNNNLFTTISVFALRVHDKIRIRVSSKSVTGNSLLFQKNILRTTSKHKFRLTYRYIFIPIVLIFKFQKDIEEQSRYLWIWQSLLAKGPTCSQIFDFVFVFSIIVFTSSSAFFPIFRFPLSFSYFFFFFFLSKYLAYFLQQKCDKKKYSTFSQKKGQIFVKYFFVF